MIVHIDKLIRHLRSQIETAEHLRSEFVYLTKREAEGCLELAEAQDVIQEMISEREGIVRCKDCKFRHNTQGVTKWLPCMEMTTANDWFCADGERRTE